MTTNALIAHMQRLLNEKGWEVHKAYLQRALAVLEAEEGDVAALVEARFSAGCCIRCGREPCSHCGDMSSVWCEVCWRKIQEECPPGMVVSGLAQVMHRIGKALPRTPAACMQRLLDCETPEDAEKIKAALEPGWEKDWSGAFSRAADKVLGKPWYREGS